MWAALKELLNLCVESFGAAFEYSMHRTTGLLDSGDVALPSVSNCVCNQMRMDYHPLSPFTRG